MPDHVIRSLALVAALGTIAHADKDPDGEIKLSLPTESDRVAWLRPGFRLGLGIMYGEMVGLRGVRNGRELAVNMHAGLRLDADWSLIASFKYGRVSAANGITGFIYSGTLDPTWHVTHSFSLAAGMGFGGIVSGRTNAADVEPLGANLQSGYTFSSSNPAMPFCDGNGLIGVLRAEYSWVLGPRSSTHVELEVVGQYISCQDPTGVTEPDTATPIVRTQYWPMTGGTLSWGLTWR
ncbi:MAG TPA: hypothetical protein VGL61_22880 [Kofleriaceae bacterium]|jgi:hypothetical protein